jgi:hypothetical protein
MGLLFGLVVVTTAFALIIGAYGGSVAGQIGAEVVPENFYLIGLVTIIVNMAYALFSFICAYALIGLKKWAPYALVIYNIVQVAETVFSLITEGFSLGLAVRSFFIVLWIGLTVVAFIFKSKIFTN